MGAACAAASNGSVQITCRPSNEAVKANKLLQIVCGMAYGTDGEAIYIDNTPRIQVVKEFIEESEGKVIVFVVAEIALAEGAAN